MPASRSAAATTLAPRSWPSRPGLPTSTRILRAIWSHRPPATSEAPSTIAPPRFAPRDERARSLSLPEAVAPLPYLGFHAGVRMKRQCLIFERCRILVTPLGGEHGRQ